MSAVCGACGWPTTEPLFCVREFDYVRCLRCRSGRIADMSVTPSGLYSASYFQGSESGGYLDYDRDAAIHAWTARRRLARLTKRVPPGEVRLLDIGCATGYVLAAARSLGWRAVGVDVSAHAREEARARGLAAEATVAEGLQQLGGPPTVITGFQVFEHMVDPVAELVQATAQAEPGAVVAIETWDLGSWTARMFGAHWQQANPPTVQHLFTRAGLRAMASRSGLRPVSVRISAKPVSLGLVAGVASQAWPAIGSRVAQLVTRLGADGTPIPYFFDDLVTLLACVPRRNKQRP